MKRLLVVFLFFAAIPIFAQDIKRGDTAVVLTNEQVEVKNLEPVRQIVAKGLRWLTYGESCSVQKDGAVTVIGVDGNRIFVKYTAPNNPTENCPSDVLFFLTREEFSKMLAVQAARQNEQALVRRLLTQK